MLRRATSARVAPLGLMARAMATAATSTSTSTPTLMSDVHGTTHGKKHWRNKPLFRREGDKKFRSGQEAADMLYGEVAYRLADFWL